MQLIYLYIENYKNINDEGFNFTTQFHCDYKDGTLTIDKNENYIENFFGDNIEVSAIVGENGSGKSSIFEILTLLYWQGLILDRKDKTFFVFYNDSKFYIQCENYKSLPLDENDLNNFINIVNHTNIEVDKYFCARGTMPLISFTNCMSDITINKKFEHLKNYSYYYNGVQPQKPMMKSEENYSNFTQKFYHLLSLDKNYFSFINENFIFDTYRLEIYFSELESYLVQSNNEELKRLLTFQTIKTSNKKELIYHFCIVFCIELTSSLLMKNYIQQNNSASLEEQENYLKNIIEDDVVVIIKNNLTYLQKYEKVLEVCHERLNEIQESIKDIFNNENIKHLLDYFKSGDMPEDKSYTLLASNNLDIKGEFISNPLLNILQEYQILRFNFFKASNIEHSFLRLSVGEKLYLNVLTNFAFTVNKLLDGYKGILLFDEIELSFHPNWQKRVIKDLLGIYNKAFDTKTLELHLIFTSHSPFILSDIPRQNIVFLKDGKQVDALEKKQTFGANIHTLLADGFFMDGGLMGEFAKEKIEEVIKFLNDDKSKIKDKKEVLNLIDIIGEPFLKQKLQDMYFKKFNDNSIDEQIKKLELEIERLKNVKS